MLHQKQSRDRTEENARRHANAPEHKCEACGDIFRRRPSSKDAARFCSRACGYVAKANVQPSKDGVDRVLAKQAKSMCVRFKVAMCKCLGCGSRFHGASIASSYCTDGCKKVAARNAARLSSIANDNVDRSPRPCAECGQEFSTSYGDMRSVFCSEVCARKRHKRTARKKERARLRAAFVESVDPIKVFERDKWKCQLCGCKTPRSLRGTYDDMAPELDHIMPLALGGAHSYMNTQCLCRKCNAAKSDTPPVQVGLFAYG
ncbi:MAG: HNH endonuclease [Rhizobium sp.]|nr:HNH endonuclease [Rhizobium sp.]